MGWLLPKFKGWRLPLEAVPKVYTLAKWVCLITIAISCAVMAFTQSLLVSGLYEVRSKIVYQLVASDVSWFIRYLQYASFNLLLAFGCSFSIFIISPAASGSGIPDVKAFLNGVESPIFKNFFRIRTFIGKVIGSALAVSSSLVMGKEGPMLHAGSILAVILGSNKWLQQQMEVAAHWGIFTYNKEIRDLVAVGAACGVTTAFKAPVGGVMFAMEMSTRWSKELTWRAFMACAVTVMSVRLLSLVCVDKAHCDLATGQCHNRCEFLKWGSLIWFKMTLPTPYQQVWAVIILALITGYLGSLFTSFNTWVCIVRKRWAKHMWARIAEVCVISVITSSLFFAMPVAGGCLPCDQLNPGDETQDGCIKGNVEFHVSASYRCREEGHYNDMAALVFNPQGYVIQALFQSHSGTFSFPTLALYSLVYWLLAAITYGAFIPSGLFTPSLIFGGCVGRLFAEVLVLLGVADNSHVGLYALLGAAGFLGGLMRMSAAQALILMEMTQSPQQLPFLMFTLVLSKSVGDHFNYSVFDHQMMLKGLAFVGIDEGKAKKSRMNARDVMAPCTTDMRQFGCTLGLQEPLGRLVQVLEVQKEAPAFPVVVPPKDGDVTQGSFLGLVSRANLAALVEGALRDRSGGAGHDASGGGGGGGGDGDVRVDLSTKVEVAPAIIPPNMPLPFVYRIVNSEGFNFLPVIRMYGRLEGVVSRHELVEVQNKRLDEFHLKDQIEKMEQEVDQGNLIQSMNLTGNVHAEKFKTFIRNPLAATKEYLATDEGRPVEEQQEFFLDVEGAGGDVSQGGLSYRGFRGDGSVGSSAQRGFGSVVLGDGAAAAANYSAHSGGVSLYAVSGQGGGLQGQGWVGNGQGQGLPFEAGGNAGDVGGRGQQGVTAPHVGVRQQPQQQQREEEEEDESTPLTRGHGSSGPTGPGAV